MIQQSASNLQVQMRGMHKHSARGPLNNFNYNANKWEKHYCEYIRDWIEVRAFCKTARYRVRLWFVI